MPDLRTARRVDLLRMASPYVISGNSRSKRPKPSRGSRTDSRDLRTLYMAAGYTYVWNTPGFAALAPANLPVLGLFERDHMEFEADRATDLGGGTHAPHY